MLATTFTTSDLAAAASGNFSAGKQQAGAAAVAAHQQIKVIPFDGLKDSEENDDYDEDDDDFDDLDAEQHDNLNSRAHFERVHSNSNGSPMDRKATRSSGIVGASRARGEGVAGDTEPQLNGLSPTSNSLSAHSSVDSPSMDPYRQQQIATATSSCSSFDDSSTILLGPTSMLLSHHHSPPANNQQSISAKDLQIDRFPSSTTTTTPTTIVTINSNNNDVAQHHSNLSNGPTPSHQMHNNNGHSAQLQLMQMPQHNLQSQQQQQTAPSHSHPQHHANSSSSGQPSASPPFHLTQALSHEELGHHLGAATSSLPPFCTL